MKEKFRSHRYFLNSRRFSGISALISFIVSIILLFCKEYMHFMLALIFTVGAFGCFLSISLKIYAWEKRCGVKLAVAKKAVEDAGKVIKQKMGEIRR